MIEIFKTNVHKKRHADAVLERLKIEFSKAAINFDLEDCDRILRFESHNGHIEPDKIIDILNYRGFRCEILAD